MSVPSVALNEFLGAYRSYLEGERGLGALTIGGYVSTAELFLRRRCGGDPGRVASLGARDVSGFVLSESDRGLSPRTVNEVVVRLRSFLRYLYVKGLIAAPLAQATPWMAHSRDGSLPRSLEPGAAEALLASCDRSTVVGRRDYAVLTLLVRLGLRAREIVTLSLDDVDWRAGTISIRGKARSADILPLPSDVGEVLADYLELRESGGDCRSLFVKVVPPYGGITPTGVNAIVRYACWRAGIAQTGTHRFRHGVATELLSAGATLPEIGQLLRHHHLQTTAVYAKVDFSALASVAQPWPGARA
jgi:site-specific recombinase XerD